MIGQTSSAHLGDRNSKAEVQRPYELYRGTVLLAFQTLGVYDVVTDAGRYWATYHGGGRGILGAQESGAFCPGQGVWVAVQPVSGRAFVVGAAAEVQPDPDYAGDIYLDLAVHPRMVGQQYDARFVGKLRAEQLEQVRNHGTGHLLDALDGEWAVTSPFGPGVGVEHFRSWLRGGPLAEVVCFGEENPTTRIVGERLETISLFREREEGRIGSSSQIVDRKHYSSAEANDIQAQPRNLVVEGGVHGGAHQYIASPYALTGQRRFGLLHEHRGLDGTYLLETASSLVLRKTCNIYVPDEYRGDPVSLMTKAEENQSDVSDAVANPRQELLQDEEDEEDPAGTLNSFGRVREFVENLLWRGRNGTSRLRRTWLLGADPQDVIVSPVDPAPAQDNTRSDVMWRIIPRPFVIADPSFTKQFFVGTASVVLADDGSIILEDAWHSQIIMSKGNIRISAAKDLILESGRNLLEIAGQDAAVRSARHLDLDSNAGRVHIKAEHQLNLLGGNGGTGGVLIESRAEAGTLSTAQGAAQASGGLVLSSAGDMNLLASNMHLTAATSRTSSDEKRGVLTLNSDNLVMVTTPDMLASFAQEFSLSFLTAEGTTGFVAGPNRTVAHALFTDVVSDMTDDGVADIMRAVDEQAYQSSQFFTYSILANALLLNPENWVLAGFQHCTTEDLGLADTLTFELPETSWQQHLPASSGAGWGYWQENVVVTPYGASCAFPGPAAWLEEDRYIQFPESCFYRFEDGRADMLIESRLGPDGTALANSQDPPLSLELPPVTVGPINSNYRRGSSV
jgi:hypothetical protein